MSVTTKAHPGRPIVLSPEVRRRRILAAAERIFVQTGYGAASMEDIARACEMSKKTLYQYFLDKEAIFIALVTGYDVHDFLPDEEPVPCDDPYEDLRQTLTDMTKFILSSRQLAMSRLVISEAHHSPVLARGFYENCLVRFREQLVVRLSRMLGRHPGCVGNVDRLADMIFGSIVGDIHIEALICNVDDDMIGKYLLEMGKRIDIAIDLLKLLGRGLFLKRGGE